MAVTDQLLSADDLIDNPELAKLYLEKRRLDLETFMKSLRWKQRNAYTVSAIVYGNEIVHELRPCQLHAFPIWGELFWLKAGEPGKEDPVIFYTFDCFAAYVLAKWW